MMLFSFFMATIICDLYEASSDFVLLGEDLVVVLGVSMYIHTCIILSYFTLVAFTCDTKLLHVSNSNFIMRNIHIKFSIPINSF